MKAFLKSVIKQFWNAIRSPFFLMSVSFLLASICWVLKHCRLLDRAVWLWLCDEYLDYLLLSLGLGSFISLVFVLVVGFVCILLAEAFVGVSNWIDCKVNDSQGEKSDS